MPTPSPIRVPFSRRTLLSSGVAAAATAVSAPMQAAPPRPQPFKLCLNMSTIRGHELDAAAEIETAGQAGYDAIEPWFRKIDEYVQGGGKLSDLRKRIEDHGLEVASAIGFASWIVDDETQRAAGFETAKRDMDTLAQLGGTRLAAPPAGAKASVDLDRAAERYRALLELGDQMGVVPQVEMWGGHPAIGTVDKAITIAIKADHPKACFLGDVYHTYKGGCGFEGFRLLGPRAMLAFHLNDYPADPPRSVIKDEHRVYPGDGIAPITELLRTFLEIGASPVLSLELFNPSYWQRPVAEVAQTGLDKMRAAVARALEPVA